MLSKILSQYLKNMATAKVLYKSSTSKTPTLRFPKCSLLSPPTSFSPSPQFRLSLTASTIAWVPLRRIYGRRSLLLCQRVARSPHHCHQNGWRAQAWQSCHHHRHPFNLIKSFLKIAFQSINIGGSAELIEKKGEEEDEIGQYSYS